MIFKIGIIVFCISAVAAEIVYLHDTNGDHEKRNLDFGLPENLQFRVMHSGNDVMLNLRENKRLNANAPIYEPATDESGNMIAVKNENIGPNNRVRYYQDAANGAFITAECMRRESGPCTRLLTGNLVVNGREHKLEPAMEELNKRELPAHLGTPHTMEPLSQPFYLGDVTDHGDGGRVVAAHTREEKEEEPEEIIDYVTHDPDTSTYPTTTEDYDQPDVQEVEEQIHLADQFLLERLLERLGRQKRSPVAHGIELMMVIDHVVYNDFAARYTGDEEIKFRIREYYSHIINGVDLRYSSIAEEDISFYVTVSGFFISNNESTSPWLDYSRDFTNGLSGLSFMRKWRTSCAGIPAHDHAALITGTDITYRGSSRTVGLAYLDGVCSSYRVSVNEELGLFKGSGVLAHEIGHNLGAAHDSGKTDSGCSKADDFVMSPVVPRLSADSTGINPWRFSSCSIDAFRNYLKGLGGSDCTLNQGVIYDEDEFNKHTIGLAGQLYSVEEQCVLLQGVGSQVCADNQNTTDICRNMRCQPSGSSSCNRYIAAHGTPCGNNMMCFEGLCQKEIPTPSPTPSTTLVPTPIPTSPSNGYTCQDKGAGGMTCDELETFMGNPYKMCKTFFGQCCKHCYENMVCKRNKKVYAAKKYDCATIIASLGLETTCTLFPLDCCLSCQELAIGTPPVTDP